MAEPLRIAMWSGPRNLSTAMMRSFSSRSDCAVIDEPFYAAYLERTGIDHPMREQVLGGERDVETVVRGLMGPVPEGAHIYYQKHMLAHMIEDVPRDWMEKVTNVFLIRDPARVLTSYQAKRTEVSFADFGILQQADFFEAETDPIVVDAADILEDPRGMLSKLCEALGIVFDPAMLCWPKGPHKDDGIWGEHWYGGIWASTGFGEPDVRPRPDVGRADIMGPAMDTYEAMRAVRLR